MLSSERHKKAAKSDVAVLKIPGICVGGLTGSAGEISQTHRAQNERGTSHIYIKKKNGAKSFMEL